MHRLVTEHMTKRHFYRLFRGELANQYQRDFETQLTINQLSAESKRAKRRKR